MFGVRWLLTLALVFLTCGCARPAREVEPRPARVVSLSSTSRDVACVPDEAAMALQQRVLSGEVAAERVQLRCVPTGDGADAITVESALDVLAMRVGFLGAPPERNERTWNTLTAWVPVENRVDLAQLTARGALSLHEVDETGLLALQERPLPAAAIPLGVGWEPVENALAVRSEITPEQLDAAIPVAGRRWVKLPFLIGFELAVLVHPPAVTLDDVQSCAAREVGGVYQRRVRVEMTPAGSASLASMTERAVGSRVVVELDGVLLSFPRVGEPMMDGVYTLASLLPDLLRVHRIVLLHPLPEGVHCAPAPPG
jgi:hypothetical protein